jgi:hypothetical protein
MNSLGNMFNVEGPTLYTISLFHDAATEPDTARLRVVIDSAVSAEGKGLDR